MNRHLPWLLLAGSVLFNVFFLAGYLQARQQAAEAPPETAAAPAELRLDDSQREIYRRFESQSREEGQTYRRAMHVVEQQLLAELAADSPDAERIRGIVDEELELRRAWRMAMVERLREFTSLLTPEQRAQVLQRMHERGGRMGRALGDFDHDGDGKLNPEEATEAMEHFRRRQAEMDAQRLRIMEQFDADGDGELNDEEKRALRTYFHEQRERNGGRGGRGGPRGPRGSRGPRGGPPDG